MKPWMIVVAVALVVTIGAFLLLRGGTPTEEDRVREAIEAVAEGAREAHVNNTLATVSLRYHDDDGLDRDKLKAVLFQRFHKSGPITVLLGPILVELPEPGVAEAHFEAALAEDWDVLELELLPAEAELLHFDVELELEEGEWRIVRHERSRVTR